MRAEKPFQVIEMLHDCSGVRVPLDALPEVLGPNWYELESLGSRELSADDKDILATCLLQALLGEVLAKDGTADEDIEVYNKLQDAAAVRGWETDDRDGS